MARTITKPLGRPARGGPTVRAVKIAFKADINERFEQVCAAYDAKYPSMGDNPGLMAKVLFIKGLEALEKEFGLQPEELAESSTKK